jgi:transposase InsO family protein
MKGQWLEEEQKLEILSIVSQAKGQGLSISRTCFFWKINRRRVVRWRMEKKRGQSMINFKPGPRMPVHKLLPEEIGAVLQMAVREEYADMSHRILAVTAWDLKIFFVSFSSVYRILASNNLMSMRGNQGRHNGHSIPPVRRELTGPNQRWCWDISYLLTCEKGLYLYLYLLLDEYSRKVVSWLISWHQTADEAKRLLEQGLINENILDLPEDQRPEVINDRGRQMKAKSIKNMFEDHNMPQFFSRPRTPNDNPFIESMFSTIKGAPQYPGRFLDLEGVYDYFNRFFPWYNKEHLHSGIDYVTPEQCHLGLREQIVSRRKADLKKKQHFRKEVNQQNQKILTDSLNPVRLNLNQKPPCSVINL